MASRLSRREILSGLGIAALLPKAFCEESEKNLELWDVIVIGAGAAGLAAAIAARKAGASVLVVEKMSRPGGNSAISTGDMAVCGSPVQKKLGIIDSAEIMAQDLLRQGRISDPERCRFVSRGALSAWSWTIHELGVEWERNALQYDAGQSVPRGHMMHPRSGATLIAAELTRTEALKIEIRTGVMMLDILRDPVSGTAVGIVAAQSSSTGTRNSLETVILGARRGVVLAFGGFGADAALRGSLNPRMGRGVQTTNQPGATGEAILAAKRAGCRLIGMEHIQALPFVAAEEIGIGFAWPFIEYVTAMKGIWVNDDGKRFISKTAGQKERADALLEIAAQGGRIYGLADERAFSSTCPDYLGQRNWEESLRRGVIHRYNTLAELAQDFDIPAAALESTIKEFNLSCIEGKDVFGRSYKEARPLVEPPWYLIEIQAKAHHTMGGIAIKPAGEAVDASGRIIAGLFAAGESTGGLFGVERIPSHSLTDALVTGLSAGRLAARRISP